jgi:hypothetical protein
MKTTGGIRFLPVFGGSGSGKTSATLELGTHLPILDVFKLSRAAIEDYEQLKAELRARLKQGRGEAIVAVVDQFEEVAEGKSDLPRKFVENISIIDRDEEFRGKRIIFIWLTTTKEFRALLSQSTSRNTRILLQPDFEVVGPGRDQWRSIIEETFRFHNQNKSLSDHNIIEQDIDDVVAKNLTLGGAIQDIDKLLFFTSQKALDLSDYRVIMLWPVTDGLRITRVSQFTDARQGYKLDWGSFFRELNKTDQEQLPLQAYNRSRLYFDVRVVPIQAADLQPFCRDLDDTNFRLARSHVDSLKRSHFFSILNNAWSPANYGPMNERESARQRNAEEWYHKVNQQPTRIGARLAAALQSCGFDAQHEGSVESKFSKIRGDVIIRKPGEHPGNIIVELKCYTAENTRPSSIREAIAGTLRKYAIFAGFLER